MCAYVYICSSIIALQVRMYASIPHTRGHTEMDMMSHSQATFLGDISYKGEFLDLPPQQCLHMYLRMYIRR